MNLLNLLRFASGQFIGYDCNYGGCYVLVDVLGSCISSSSICKFVQILLVSLALSNSWAYSLTNRVLFPLSDGGGGGGGGSGDVSLRGRVILAYIDKRRPEMATSGQRSTECLPYPHPFLRYISEPARRWNVYTTVSRRFVFYVFLSFILTSGGYSCLYTCEDARENTNARRAPLSNSGHATREQARRIRHFQFRLSLLVLNTHHRNRKKLLKARNSAR